MGVGTTLFALGLGLCIIFPPAGLVVVAIGIYITVKENL